MAILSTAACPLEPCVPIPWLPRWLILGTLLLLSTTSFTAAPPTITREYQVKAVFLYNFAQFVEWPASAFPDDQAPLIIGVLGRDPFDRVLDEIVRDEQVGRRPLLVRRWRRSEDIDACHILFISNSETPRLEQILSRLKDRAILTVSDAEEFARRGGMIRFLTDRNRIRLRINLEAARDAGLVLSSKLLRPAEIVDQPEVQP